MTTVFENERIKVEVNNGWQVVITDKDGIPGTQLTVSADASGLYAESESRFCRADNHTDGSAALRIASE